MSVDHFRQDDAWRPAHGEPFVYLEVWNSAARVHFRLGGGQPLSTDWLNVDRARSRALEIARLEDLPLPLVERSHQLPPGTV